MYCASGPMVMVFTQNTGGVEPVLSATGKSQPAIRPVIVVYGESVDRNGQCL